MDWVLVRIPTPQDPVQLEATGFTLFHGAGDDWIGSLPKEAVLPIGSEILAAYEPTNGELYEMQFITFTTSREAEKLTGNVNLLYCDGKRTIFQATQAQIASLPNIKGELTLITLTPKSMRDVSFTLPSCIDSFNPFVLDLVNQVLQTQYTQYNHTLQNFGTRNSYTAQCDNAAGWIYNTMQSFGLSVSYDYFILGSLQRRNVIGEKLGTVHPDSIVFITSHYDATAGSPGLSEPLAPGADDNGSGTACVLECARILSQYAFEKTIRFCAFCGEEQGLVGSSHYVQVLQQDSAHVVGSFNWDMIAWSGLDPLPADLIIYTNNNPISLAMANKIAEAVNTYLPGAINPVVTYKPSMSSGDHGPFWEAGWGAICGIEAIAWGPDFNPNYHTVNELIVNTNQNYAANCTRAAIAALADFAIPVAESGPVLTIQNKVIDDVGGNGNGVADLGEDLIMTLSIVNVGNLEATGIAGTLTTTNPYTTITHETTAYPNLSVGDVGSGTEPYLLTISATCPWNTWVNTTLTITANQGNYTHNILISFLVGDPANSPIYLEQNRPNPFNSSTVISYQLSAINQVSLKVFATSGRLVATLVDGWQEAGAHQVRLDGSCLTSGLYFLQMRAGNYTSVKKIMLVK